VALSRKTNFALAQIGQKSNAEATLALLLTAVDIPGGNWKMMDERSWRAGTVGPHSAWSKRTRAAKNIVGWRSFEQQSAEKWMWVQVVPYVSVEDASSALAHAELGDGIPNSGAEVHLVKQTTIEEFELEGVDAARVLIQSTSGPRGDSEARIIYSAVNSFVAVEAYSGLAGAWNEIDMSLIATLQASRLKTSPQS
jgi:hypothetical protein